MMVATCLSNRTPDPDGSPDGPPRLGTIVGRWAVLLNAIDVIVGRESLTDQARRALVPIH